MRLRLSARDRVDSSLSHNQSPFSSTISLTGSHLVRHQSCVNHLDKIARGWGGGSESEGRRTEEEQKDLMPSLGQPDITLEREQLLSCQYFVGSETESFPSVAYYRKTTPDLSLPSDPQLTQGSGSSQPAGMNSYQQQQHDYGGASMQPPMLPYQSSLPSLSALTSGSMQPPPLPPVPQSFQQQQQLGMAGYAPPPSPYNMPSSSSHGMPMQQPQSLSPGYQQHQLQLQQPPMFSQPLHIPPGANLISQNSTFPRRGPPVMAPPGMQTLPDGSQLPGPNPFCTQPELRIHEMNKRLQQRPEENDNLWWDAFATEFFEDESRITIRMSPEGEQASPGPRPLQYSIGRNLIPRFFRSFFEGGVVELQFQLQHPRETFMNGVIILDCDNAVQMSTHIKPTFAKVFTEGRLIIQFSSDEMMRIRSWMFITRHHQEFIPRHYLNMAHDPVQFEQHSKNITNSGFHMATISFLRLCVILEPMQQLMSRNKAFPAIPPRECLTGILFDKWKSTVSGQPVPPVMSNVAPQDPEGARTNTKRRKRKASTGRGGGSAGAVSANGPIPGGGNTGSSIPLPASKKGKGNGGGSNSSLSASGMPLATQDVMIVGEPTLMGGDFGDEDERLITRLENSNYDPSLAGQMQTPLQALQRSVPPDDRSASVQHETVLHYTSSPSRGGGSWQSQTRPSSVTTSNNGNDSKKSSPNS